MSACPVSHTAMSIKVKETIATLHLRQHALAFLKALITFRKDESLMMLQVALLRLNMCNEYDTPPDACPK